MPVQSVTLKKDLGLVGGISYVAGTIIGAGIFISPSAVLIGCGGSVGLTLCMWTLSGLIALCGAICYAELGSRVKKSGGDYTYIKEAFGDLFGFIFLWFNLLTRPMSAAVGCMASAQYIISSLSCSETIPKSSTVLLTLVILVFITAMNCYSVKLGSYYQTVSTVCKVFVLVVIIVTGIIHLAQGHDEHFKHPFNLDSVTVLGLTKAFYASYFAYGGCDAITAGTEEFRNSRRTVPLSLLIGVLIPTVVYVCTNVAYHAVLTNDEITSGIAVALVFSRHKLGFFQWMILPIVGLFAAVSVNCNVFLSSRLNFVAGRDKLFPRFLGMANIYYRTPLVSILLLLVSTMLVVIIGDIKTIMSVYTFLKVMGTTVSILSLPALRKRYGEREVIVTAPLMCRVIFVVVSTMIGIIFIYLDIEALLLVSMLLGSGIVTYFLSKSSFIDLKPVKTVNDFITNICYKLLLCEHSTHVNYD